MLGSLISRHGIKLAVVILVAGTLYNNYGRVESTDNGYNVVPFKSNTLYFKGDLDDSTILQIGDYLQEVGMFTSVSNVEFVVDASTNFNDGQINMMLIWDPTKINSTVLVASALTWLGLKKEMFSNFSIKGCFANQSFQLIDCYTEKELESLLSEAGLSPIPKTTTRSQDQGMSEPEEDYKEKNLTVDEIISKWDVGATRLSKAEHYLSINNNAMWKIFYEEKYSESANILGQLIYDNKLVDNQNLKCFAFYANKETQYFNGEMAYYFAIPFNEKDLNSGAAEELASKYFQLFKQEYMKNVNLVIALCDYDFNIIKLQAN